MNIAVIIPMLTFVAGLTFGGVGVRTYYEGEIARKEVAQKQAQDELQQRVDKAEAEAATKLIDMQAAYDAGEANAKVVTKVVYERGKDYVAQTPAFANPDCVVPDNGLSILNSARRGIKSGDLPETQSTAK